MPAVEPIAPTRAHARTARGARTWTCAVSAAVEEPRVTLDCAMRYVAVCREALAGSPEALGDAELRSAIVASLASALGDLRTVREVLGMAVGPSEAEPFWSGFLRTLTRRGLRGVKLVIADSHEGLKAAVAKVLKATWQRCKVHFLRNALAHAGKGQRQMVLAMINTIFAQETPDAASAQWRTVTDQLRTKFPKLAAMMERAEADVLAFMGFPKAHRVQIHSTNPLERVNAEVKRRTDVVGIFPNDAAITCLVGAILLEQSDEWSLQRRYMQLEGLQGLVDNQPARLSAVVR